MEQYAERCTGRAGTGMVAELFLENGNAAIAAEPNAEMRAACARWLSRYLGLRVVNAWDEWFGEGSFNPLR